MSILPLPLLPLLLVGCERVDIVMVTTRTNETGTISAIASPLWVLIVLALTLLTCVEYLGKAFRNRAPK